MLFVLFHLGLDRYVLDASRVVEILPLVNLQRIAGAPTGVAGVFNYRGQPVPTVDLTEMTLGRPALERLNTRLIIIRYPDAAGQDHLLGLIAERVTGTIRRDKKHLVESGLNLGVAPYLGPVMLDDQGVIQVIRDQHLLPAQVRDMLLSEPQPANR